MIKHNDKTISDYKIENGSEISSILQLKGGMKINVISLTSDSLQNISRF